MSRLRATPACAGFHSKPQCERVGRRGPRAPRFRAQPHRRRLEHDAVPSKVREKCRADAALHAHPRERVFRIDERAERDFLGIGLVCRGSQRCHCDGAGSDCAGACNHALDESEVPHVDQEASAANGVPFSIMSCFRLLSMRPFTPSCALFTAVLALSVPATAQTPAVAAKTPATAPAATPASNPPIVLQGPGAPAAPTIAAASWVLLDTLSGQTLGAANAEERRDPASLTKLMTAYVAFGALRAQDDHAFADGDRYRSTRGAPKARACSSSRARRVSVDELLRGVIVQSGNDASIALAEARRAAARTRSSSG